MLPREKLLRGGIDSLSDNDLIAILISSGIKNRDFNTISLSVLKSIKKTIKEGREISIQSLSNIQGVGKITAMKILSAIELGRRIYGLYREDKITVQNSRQAYNLLKNLSKLKQEHIVALYLNARFELIEQKTIRIGGIDNSQLLPRDVIIYALEYNAPYVVLAHNHPSGECTPSKEDILMTQRVDEAMNIVGLELLEHIVVAKDGWKSVDF